MEILELTPECNSKSLNICMIVFLTLMMYTLSFIECFIPIPLGLFMLYIFRFFNEKAAKALMMSDALSIISVLILSNIFVIFRFIDLLSDAGFVAIFMRDGNSFSNKIILKMGFISGLVFSVCGILIVICTEPLRSILHTMSIITVINVLLASFIIVGTVVGFAYLSGLKILRKSFGDIYNINNIRMH